MPRKPMTAQARAAFAARMRAARTNKVRSSANTPAAVPIQQGRFTTAPSSALQSGGVKIGTKPAHVQNPPASHSGNTKKARGITAKLSGRGTASLGRVK